MKTALAISALTLALNVNAQVINYLENDPVWRQEWKFFYTCHEIQEYMYYINGDTTIDDYNYKKLYDRHHITISWYGPEPSPCEGDYYSDEAKILIRQEGRKMYVRDQNGETLLYDFGLNVGDTLPETYNLIDNNITVTGIDSILVGDSYRKVFNLSGSST